MRKLKGKVIWITGASSGIGEELAYQLSRAEAKLIISARRESVLNTVKTNCSYPNLVTVLPLDLNAFKVAVYEELIKTDYLGVVALTKAVLPHFISQKSGHFVTVSSLMGKFASPYRSGYCGAKHALHGFFDALRMEHEKDTILVTMVCPGFVSTNVAKSALTGDGSQQRHDDAATAAGLDVSIFCKKMIHALQKKKYEVYIGGKEVRGVYLKRFFPKLLHKVVLKNKVR